MPHPAPRSTDRDAATLAASAAAHFFAQSADLLCVVATDGGVRHANRAYARTTGWSPDPRDPRDASAFASFVHADDRATLAAAWGGVLNGRAADGLVLRVPGRDRPDRWISWQLSAADAEGLVHGIGRDVTEREAAVHALRASEARYQHIAANVPGVVYQFVQRPDGTNGYTFVSEGARTMFGVAPEAALADPTTLLRLIHPDELAQFRTELHRATQQLEASEQRHRSLFAHNPDAVYSFDLDLRFTSANPACEALIGYTREEILAGAASPVVIPEDREVAIAAFHTALGGEPVRIEVGVRHRSGRVVRVGVTNVPIVVGGRVVGIFGIAKDLTAQHALEDRLRQAQKMEAVGKLAGGIAHDFNNLLMVIQSYGGFLADELADATTARADLEEMLRAARRAQELTKQLLAFGRKQVLRPRRLDANRKVADVAAMLRRIIGADITLVTELEPAPWAVVADSGQLEQVLLNLAVNARDAMPDGGTLRLRTENRVVGAAGTAPCPGQAAGRYVALVVEDAGVGIPADVLPHIFEPFFTTKPVGQGTGLGLATVYGIVEQSGGCVTVDSAPGLGSRFTVMLPAVESPTPSPAAGDRPALPAGAETILLVEDEVEVRAAVRRMLERQGYVVRVAATGAEALQLADAAASGAEGPVDLVLTDLVMPELGGHALGERLAARHPGIRVLYMSGYTDDAIFRRGLADAGATLIEKPFTAGELAHAVRRALEKGAGG